jgi:hypothetical protein
VSWFGATKRIKNKVCGHAACHNSCCELTSVEGPEAPTDHTTTVELAEFPNAEPQQVDQQVLPSFIPQ